MASGVKWRESVKYMIQNGTNSFIEIGPGKVLSGLIKRIDRKIKVNAINNEEDITILKPNMNFKGKNFSYWCNGWYRCYNKKIFIFKCLSFRYWYKSRKT